VEPFSLQARLEDMADPSSSKTSNVEAKLRRHIRILVDLGRLCSETSDVERFLDLAVIQVARAVEIDHVKILRYRRTTADLIIAAGVGWREGVVRASTLSADLRSPPGLAFQTGEPVLISDCSEASQFVFSEVLKEHGIVALANVPLLIDGSAWGVLEVDSTTPREFGSDTIELLMAASAVIGAFLRGQEAQGFEANRLASEAVKARDRELALREMQHRVKNNFQVILASITLQRRRFQSSDVDRALDHVANRINAISLAHDQLAPGNHDQVVDLAGYLRVLCASIEQQSEGVTIEVEADEIELSLDRAVPLGLILNEAATNSVKHAFSEASGRILVSLRSGVGHGEARLVVADNGQGIKAQRPGGSGLKLMSSLARQIGATIEQSSSSAGVTTSLTFPVIS
jgi:two-component sensor histidine kinase